MDEFIQLLDEIGNPTGNPCLKSVAHQKGLFHSSVHIWFFTQKKEILIQERKKTKDTFPGLYDVSVAGHILFGETPIFAAIREIKEEIGLSIKQEELEYLGVSTHKNLHSKNITDFELRHIYLCKLNVTFKSLKIQKEEIEEIKLISITDFPSEYDSKSYAPHGNFYYKKILNAIEQKL